MLLMRPTFRWTVAHPFCTRSGLSLAKPESTRYMPPANPFRSPFRPCETEPMRRPRDVSRSSSSRICVMSALISITPEMSPSIFRIGAVVTNMFIRLPSREVTISSRVWGRPSSIASCTGQGEQGSLRCLYAS